MGLKYTIIFFVIFNNSCYISDKVELMKKIITLFSLLFLLTTTAKAETVYYIEVSHDDEFFIINGEKYSAQTYCFDMEEDDPVIFIEGSPWGACATAEIINLRTKQICKLWCE